MSQEATNLAARRLVSRPSAVTIVTVVWAAMLVLSFWMVHEWDLRRACYLEYDEDIPARCERLLRPPVQRR